MRIVCISDTHLQHKFEVPDGDILIHAGDLTFQGKPREVYDAARWLNKLPHKHKIVIAGNHDWLFEKEYDGAREIMDDYEITYLQDTGCVIDGIWIYGSPWQPEFCNWAFNLPSEGSELSEKWAQIPDDTDILITHGPPMGTLDETAGYESIYCGEYKYEPPKRVGCYDLAQRIQQLKNLRLHVFGHIHHSYGQIVGPNGVRFVNASICNEQYKPVNKPIVVDWEG